MPSQAITRLTLTPKFYLRSVQYNKTIIDFPKHRRRPPFTPSTAKKIYLLHDLSSPNLFHPAFQGDLVVGGVVGGRDGGTDATGHCQNSYVAAFVFILWPIEYIQRDKQESRHASVSRLLEAASGALLLLHTFQKYPQELSSKCPPPD